MTTDPFDWLFGLAQFGIKFGLHNIHAIVEALDHPERRFRSVHIAGTNGKGSVTAIVDAALVRAGFRTGRYTSPHLLDLSERFAVNGTPVTRDDLRSAVDDVRGTVEGLRERAVLEVHPTFFEVTTAVAFELFRRHDVDIAVCEVGLGGRLDATNVLTPMVSAITSISFDHEQYLGHTLREIAGEKAGIIKSSTPVVVGPVSDEAAQAISERAVACRAPIVWAKDGVDIRVAADAQDSQRFRLRTPVRDYGEVYLGLAGAHQVTNAIVAVRVLETLESLGTHIGQSAIVDALASVRWPGRLQRIAVDGGRSALLDGAHNVAGAEALAHHLRTLGVLHPLVFAAMRDKDSEAMLRLLAPVVSAIIITRPSNPRAMDPATLASVARTVAPGLRVEVEDDPGHAIERAWTQSPQIIVAGSIFLIADVMKALALP